MNINNKEDIVKFTEGMKELLEFRKSQLAFNVKKFNFKSAYAIYSVNKEIEKLIPKCENIISKEECSYKDLVDVAIIEKVLGTSIEAVLYMKKEYERIDTLIRERERAKYTHKRG